MVRLALPTGSLEEPTLALFQAAGLAVSRSSPRAYHASIGYPDVDGVVFYKPREIPLIVAADMATVGLTGADWLEETGAKVEVVHTFEYSKRTSSGWQVVLAVHQDHPARTPRDLGPGLRVATEYPSIARQYFRQLGLSVEVIHSHGSTEAKIPELADAVLEVVETGNSLRQNNLRVVDTVRRCGVKVIASPVAWADSRTRASIEMITRLLCAADAGSQQRLLTIVIPAGRWPQAERLLPDRWWRLAGSDDTALVVQGIFATEGIAVTISELVRVGVTEVVETPIGKRVVT